MLPRLAELLREHAPELAVRFAEGALTRSFVFGPTRTAHVAYDDLADLPVRDRRRSSARRWNSSTPANPTSAMRAR